MRGRCGRFGYALDMLEYRNVAEDMQKRKRGNRRSAGDWKRKRGGRRNGREKRERRESVKRRHG